MIQPKKDKSRDISLVKFLEVLQLEYISAELRKKIYRSVKDKAFWEKVMNVKKEKIIDISLRNSLQNIFNNPVIKNKLYPSIILEKGIPEFIYRNEEHKLIQRRLDILNYYSRNSEVKIHEENIVRIGIIKNVNIEAELIEVELDPKLPTQLFSISNVTRIL